jgi:hypothetical protein
MAHDDFAFETQPGIPAPLPKGEQILWQGRPGTWALARDAFGLPWVMGYFAVVVVWRATVGTLSGGMTGALAYGLPYVGLALAGAAVIMLLAWAQARATVYTVTTARVLMRIGAALQVTLNLPFRQIGAADLDLRRDGTGTIAFRTLGETKFSYLVLWPHLRPWHARITQPALRCIPDAARISRLVAEAAEARLSEPVIVRAPMVPQTAPAAAPVMPGATIAAE